MRTDTINYANISRAQAFYRALNYWNIDTPWMVSEPAIRATLPPGTTPFEVGTGQFLVGSGEQGFIQMMIDGTLVPGTYQTTTPCFRDEPVITELNRQTFLKVELISYMPVDLEAAYERMFNSALACFFEISDIETFEALKTEDGYDIMYDGIELGSYGVRKMDHHVWIYGTGIAEPRLSISTRRPLKENVLEVKEV